MNHHSEFYKRMSPTIIISMILMAALLLWDMLQDIPAIKDDVTVETIYIRSLYYQRNLKADFILGCGSVDGLDYYVFYRVLDDGGVQLMRIKALETVIYETLATDDQAYIEIERDYWGKTISTKLYVPVGAIQEQYQFQ